MSNRLETAFLIADNLPYTYQYDLQDKNYGLWSKLIDCKSLSYSRENFNKYLLEFFEDHGTENCFQVSLEDFVNVLKAERLTTWSNGKVIPAKEINFSCMSTSNIIEHCFGVYRTIYTNARVVFDYS